MAIADLRKEYQLAELRRRDLSAEPIAQFKMWFDEAAQAPSATPIEVNAMTLATVDSTGHPSARIVLLKGLDDRGFIFYTNYDSRKGRELAGNPNAALVFHWANQERQVKIAGMVKKISQSESETYYSSRPRASRLAAWASNQSEVVADRALLEERWKKLDAQYPGAEIPMPPNWGGYVLSPEWIEFWQGRPSRLHDCFRYSRQPGNTWLIERLAS